MTYNVGLRSCMGCYIARDSDEDNSLVSYQSSKALGSTITGRSRILALYYTQNHDKASHNTRMENDLQCSSSLGWSILIEGNAVQHSHNDRKRFYTEESRFDHILSKYGEFNVIEGEKLYHNVNMMDLGVKPRGFTLI